MGPAQVLLFLFAVDDYTGFEITQLLELPQPWSIIVVWGLVLPLVFLAASALTNLVLKDGLILKVDPGCLLLSGSLSCIAMEPMLAPCP